MNNKNEKENKFEMMIEFLKDIKTKYDNDVDNKKDKVLTPFEVVMNIVIMIVFAVSFVSFVLMAVCVYIVLSIAYAPLSLVIYLVKYVYKKLKGDKNV